MSTRKRSPESLRKQLLDAGIDVTTLLRSTGNVAVQNLFSRRGTRVILSRQVTIQHGTQTTWLHQSEVAEWETDEVPNAVRSLVMTLADAVAEETWQEAKEAQEDACGGWHERASR